MEFVGFLFRTSKFKNDINYNTYKFSHKFGKVCKGLNMYYSKIRIIIIFKITTMFIWIILKNLEWTSRECKKCWKWATWLCIYPGVRFSLLVARYSTCKSNMLLCLLRKTIKFISAYLFLVQPPTSWWSAFWPHQRYAFFFFINNPRIKKM